MDKQRLMEQNSRNYWNYYFLKQTAPGGEYFGRIIPVFNYVIMQNTILLYSNQSKIAFYESFIWDEKIIHSWSVDGNSDFWELSGFDKIKAIETNTCGTTLRDRAERQWD